MVKKNKPVVTSFAHKNLVRNLVSIYHFCMLWQLTLKWGLLHVVAINFKVGTSEYSVKLTNADILEATSRDKLLCFSEKYFYFKFSLL